MARFRNPTVSQTAHSVVFGRSAIRYILDAYIVESEANASANLKAAADPSGSELNRVLHFVPEPAAGQTADASDNPAGGASRDSVQFRMALTIR